MRTKLNLSPENQALLARRRNGLIKRATAPECRIMALLDELGEHYLFQKGFFTDRRFFIVDFYLPKRHKLCLEIDGKSHRHSQEYDKARDAFLRRVRGFRTLRITNESALTISPSVLALLIS
jgi:very-short-patch-repair endonuclease